MKDKKHHVDLIFIIVLIGVFAVSSIMLAIMGLDTYKDTATKDSEQQLDTAALYFAQKVRQCEKSGDIRIDTIATTDGETPALVIESDASGQALETWLFVYENNLREIASIKGTKLSANFGQQVTPLSSAEFNMVTDELLKVSLTSQADGSATINLHIGNSGEVSNE